MPAMRENFSAGNSTIEFSVNAHSDIKF
jgi:hypothetical protein